MHNGKEFTQRHVYLLPGIRNILASVENDTYD